MKQAEAIVMYHLGRASNEISLSVDGLLLDFEELIELATTIADRWVELIDIQNDEEMGYVGAYAERVIKQLFLEGKAL